MGDSVSSDSGNVAIVEYEAGLDNLAEYGTRRLTTSAIFIGFNTIALTGFGVLIAPAHFDSWRTAIEAGLLALAISPINVLWIAALAQYRRGLNTRYVFLQHLERSIFPSRDVDHQGLISVLHRPRKNGKYGHRHTSIEIALAVYFLFLFLVAALLMSVITYLVQTGSLPIKY